MIGRLKPGVAVEQGDARHGRARRAAEEGLPESIPARLDVEDARARGRGPADDQARASRAARRRCARAAHRLREHREPAAGPCRGARTRAGHPHRARRDAGDARRADARRERRALDRGRRAGAAPGIWRTARPGGAQPLEHSAHRGDPHRHAGARLHHDHLALHGPRLRHPAVTARLTRGRAGRPARGRAIERGRQRRARAPRARGVGDCARARAARVGGAPDPQLRPPAAGQSRVRSPQPRDAEHRAAAARSTRHRHSRPRSGTRPCRGSRPCRASPAWQRRPRCLSAATGPPAASRWRTTSRRAGSPGRGATSASSTRSSTAPCGSG